MIRCVTPNFFRRAPRSGLKEPAEPRLVNDIVACLRLEFRYDVRVPGVADQDMALLAIRSGNLLSDAEAQEAHAVYRIGFA
jgi:hypothetical protein